ncbi:MAG TPA: ribosomal protein S18-alanine N-acetyltransferase [Bryobacteraceae bacterium]|nr:ribosomal protein S18-alanine N-acetyltransferase [Bryobacteraceae bacterium]
MPATVEIGPFLPRHMKRVLAIEQACFAGDAYPRELFEELYEESAGLFFVARRARRIVGYCVAAAEGAEAELVSVAVLPAQRLHGVGGALLRHTIARLRRWRVRTLALTVRSDNRDAARLYRRFGFRAAGRIPNYYEDAADGLLMRLRL